MSSIYGFLGPDFKIYKETKMTTPAAYSAIKGGIINFSKYLACIMNQIELTVHLEEFLIISLKHLSKNIVKKVPLNRMGN